MGYLTQHYPNYRIRVPYDLKTNQFPRTLNGTYDDIDCYIDCANHVTISYYGKGLLEAYIPSIGRGHNYIKAIQEQFPNIPLLNIRETSEEVLFMFNGKYMEQLEDIFKPRTSGASISPFSPKNLPRNKDFKIADEDLAVYKNIVQNIPENKRLSIGRTTNDFIKSLATKKNTYDDIKADMAKKCLKGKEYIYSLGNDTWNKYIDCLRKEFNL